MKKLLLSLLLLPVGFSGHAQSLYWETEATTFSAASTGIGQFSYAGTDVIWGYGTDGTGAGTQIRVWTKSSDGGQTWSSGSINVGNTTLAIGSISAVSATTAYVSVFPDTGSTAIGGIWRTTDGGATWTKQPSASFNSATSFANIVHMWDANNGFAQGDPAGGYFEIYTTTNGGTTWTRVPSANIPAPLSEDEYGYTHNFAVNGDKVWFGTNAGRLYISENRGLNWTVVQSPISDFGGESVSGNYAFANATNGLLISSNWDHYTTTNGGATWDGSVFPAGNYRNYNVVHVPGTPNTYMTTGEGVEGDGRGSAFTTDGGASYFDINTVDLDDPINCGSAMAFADMTHGVVGGFTASSADGGAYRWIGQFLATVDFQSSKAYTVSPNPTSGEIQINGQKIAQVTVFDILGKQVMNANYGALSSVSVNLSSLNSGVYMVKVSNDAGASSTIKVIKQ